MRIKLEVIHKENFKLDKWQQKFSAFGLVQNGEQPDPAAVIKNIFKNYKSFISEKIKLWQKW